MDQCHLCGGEKRTYHSCIESLTERIAKLEAAAKVPDPAQCKCRPAPEFKLGPKTEKKLYESSWRGENQPDANLEVSRETALLIAEWLRKDFEMSNIPGRIERGEWGAK